MLYGPHRLSVWWASVHVGRRTLHVDGHLLHQFEAAPLRHLSLLEVAGLQLLFMVNSAAVERVRRRTAKAAAL
jgi:hypothetical protein